jgi:hypothetical protein
MDDRGIIELFEHIARLPGARKATKPCTAGRQRPGRNRHFKAPDPIDHLPSINATSVQLLGEGGKVAFML